jgi:hypothetical protein
MIRNRLVAGGLVVGMLGGGVAGAIIGVPGLVAAQDGTTTTSTSTSTSTTSEATTTEAPTTTVKDGATTTTVAPTPDNSAPNTDNGGPGKQSRDQRLQNALAPLVANGTITQSQADAVIKALDDMGPQGGHGGRGHGFGFGFGQLRMGFDTAAKTIGIPTNELMQDLANGQSVADVAKAHNVDPQKVIDALVADAKARLDKAVAANKITQDQANQILLKEAKVIGDLVNGSLPKMPFAFGHRGFGHGGPNDQGSQDAPGSQGGNAPGSTTQGD